MYFIAVCWNSIESGRKIQPKKGANINEFVHVKLH